MPHTDRKQSLSGLWCAALLVYAAAATPAAAQFRPAPSAAGRIDI
jgi:hypothetical protein